MAGTIHAEPGEELVRSLTEGGAKKAMKVEFGETGFASRMLEQNPGLVTAGKKIASATEAAKSVVVEQFPHAKRILLLRTGGERTWPGRGHWVGDTGAGGGEELFWLGGHG